MTVGPYGRLDKDCLGMKTERASTSHTPRRGQLSWTPYEQPSRKAEGGTQRQCSYPRWPRVTAVDPLHILEQAVQGQRLKAVCRVGHHGTAGSDAGQQDKKAVCRVTLFLGPGSVKQKLRRACR